MENKKDDISYPRFLENKPCGQDLFEGKSHDTIAQNIANVIENGDTQIIGIDGEWGSGKSNMITLIQNKLNKIGNKGYNFFIYDAWGHQEDLQRRTILEELTKQLTGEKIILKNNTDWEEKLKELLSKKREVKTKTIPKLSIGIILTALAIVTTPILDIVSSNIESMLWKTLITSIPIFLVLFLLIILFIKNLRKYHKEKKFLWMSAKASMSEAFNIYTDRQKEDTTYETISEDEPSSGKFRDWMHKIDNDLKGNKLVIVFDNMDRLSKNKIQELWSSIHTFFAEEKYSNIIVIVPFDRKHIITAFKEENDNDTGMCFGNDFINKTFDAVYRVSPPIMSDWKEYLSDKWKEAFGIEAGSKTTQIYDLLSETITPREIIAFINEIVSIKQISDKSIPDEYIALFVKGKDKITANPIKEILNPSYLGALNFIYKNDTELPKYISALYYQLPVEKALDIIYTDNLKKALDAGNAEQIRLIQGQPHLFFHIIENAITKVSNIYSTIHALNECMSNKNTKQEQTIWECIYKNIQQETTDVPFEYQKILIKKITNKEEYLIKIINDKYNTTNFSALSFYDCIKQLSEIEEVDPFKYIKEKNVDAEQFIKFVGEVKEDYKKYMITCQQEKIDEYLSKLTVNDIINIHAIPYIKKDYELSAYINHLYTLIDSNINNIGNIIIIYTKLKETGKPITKILPDAQILSYFNQINNNDDFYYDLICMRIARLTNFQPNLQPSFNNVLNNTNADIVEKVTEKIEYYINYGDILINAEKMNYPIYNSVAKNLTEKRNDTSIINNIVAVIQKYDYIKQIGIDSEKFINRIDKTCNDISSKITIETIDNIPVSFYKDIMAINNKLTNICKNTAKKYLETKTKDDWKKAIISDGFEFQLLKITKYDSQACFDAFKELLVENVLANNSAFSKEKCKSLIEVFVTNGRELLSAFNNVRDCFCSGSRTMTNDIFNYYGEWLLNYAKLEEKTSSLRTIFIPTVLDDKNNVQLIMKYPDKMRRIVEIAGEENIDFKDKINNLLNNDEYIDDKDFESFANTIGIYKSTKE